MTTVAPPFARDLEGWHVRPPRGWEPVAEVCAELYRRLPEISARINEAIVRELPAFREGASVVSRDDLEWSTRRQVSSFLHTVAERRPPSEAELGVVRLVGRRSAVRGLPLQPVIACYQVGYRELWSILVEAAERAGGPAPSLLLVAGTTVWQRALATANAVSEGYQQEVAQREALEAHAIGRFLEALDRDPLAEEVDALLHDLGFDPAGSFRVLAASGSAAAGGVKALVPALLANGGTATHAQRGSVYVIVTQGLGGGALGQALRALPEGTAVGVGMEERGPAGIRSSLQQAERALGLAVWRGRACLFDEDWFAVTVLSLGDSAVRLLGRGVEVARAHPHLADAVEAFASAEFSVAESARRLMVSQNSLRYRLVRWRGLTGWDPWSYDGLSRSVAALELARTAR